MCHGGALERIWCQSVPISASCSPEPSTQDSLTPLEATAYSKPSHCTFYASRDNAAIRLRVTLRSRAKTCRLKPVYDCGSAATIRSGALMSRSRTTPKHNQHGIYYPAVCLRSVVHAVLPHLPSYRRSSLFPLNSRLGLHFSLQHHSRTVAHAVPLS